MAVFQGAAPGAEQPEDKKSTDDQHHQGAAEHYRAALWFALETAAESVRAGSGHFAIPSVSGRLLGRKVALIGRQRDNLGQPPRQ
jgi:hypothetical protein